MKGNNTQLTKSEFQVMDILWSLPEQGGFINDMLSRYPDPKPAYTTVSTFLKILTDKGFVQSRKIGKMLWFTPTLSREKLYGQLHEGHQRDFLRRVAALACEFLCGKRGLEP